MELQLLGTSSWSCSTKDCLIEFHLEQTLQSTKRFDLQLNYCSHLRNTNFQNPISMRWFFSPVRPNHSYQIRLKVRTWLLTFDELRLRQFGERGKKSLKTYRISNRQGNNWQEKGFLILRQGILDRMEYIFVKNKHNMDHVICGTWDRCYNCILVSKSAFSPFLSGFFASVSPSTATVKNISRKVASIAMFISRIWRWSTAPKFPIVLHFRSIHHLEHLSTHPPDYRGSEKVLWTSINHLRNATFSHLSGPKIVDIYQASEKEDERGKRICWEMFSLGISRK